MVVNNNNKKGGGKRPSLRLGWFTPIINTRMIGYIDRAIYSLLIGYIKIALMVNIGIGGGMVFGCDVLQQLF